MKYSPSSRLLLVFLITSVDRLPGAFEQISQLFTAKLRCFYYLEFKDLDSIQPFQLMTGITPRPCLYPSFSFLYSRRVFVTTRPSSSITARHMSMQVLSPQEHGNARLCVTLERLQAYSSRFSPV